MMAWFKNSISLILGDARTGFSFLIVITWALFAILDGFLIGDGLLTAYEYSGLNLDEGMLPPWSDGEKGVHILGTDGLGRDVFAGMIHGARVGFIISFLTISIGLLIGLFVGLIMGYYGNTGIKKNIVQQFCIVLVTPIIVYYFLACLNSSWSYIDLSSLVLVLVISIIVVQLMGRLPLKKYGLPIDIVMQRVFELKESIPGLFFILAIVAIVSSPSIFTIAIILSILIWIDFARHARAETLAIKEEDYIQSAKSAGLKDAWILIRHVLPNALPPILVVVAFSFSGVILLESTLSFLGIGIPVEEVSWGKLLTEARKTPKAWWLAVFPGLAIFLVLYAFNTLGDYFSQFQRRNG